MPRSTDRSTRKGGPWKLRSKTEKWAHCRSSLRMRIAKNRIVPRVSILYKSPNLVSERSETPPSSASAHMSMDSNLTARTLSLVAVLCWIYIFAPEHAFYEHIEPVADIHESSARVMAILTTVLVAIEKLQVRSP